MRRRAQSQKAGTFAARPRHYALTATTISRFTAAGARRWPRALMLASDLDRADAYDRADPAREPVDDFAVADID